MDAVFDPVALVHGGEVRQGTVFYACPYHVPEKGPLGVLALACLQPQIEDRYDGLRVVGVLAVGGLSFSPSQCYLDEREAVAAALADVRHDLAGLLRRERALVEQALRLGIPAGSEESLAF